jgi:hypothetical protein
MMVGKECGAQIHVASFVICSKMRGLSWPGKLDCFSATMMQQLCEALEMIPRRPMQSCCVDSAMLL